MSSFYSHFARAYITRCFAEKQKREKFNKKQLAKTEKGDVENKGTDSQIPTEAFPEEAVEPNDADAENAEEGGDGGDDDDNESQAPEDESDFSSHLDDYCHTKFINYMIPVVKNAIFSPDRTVTDNGSSLMRVYSFSHLILVIIIF